MKKLYLFGGLFIAILMVTGCSGNDEVVCTQSVSGIKIDMIMNFKNEKLDAMGLRYTLDLTNYSDEQISQIEGQDTCSNVQSSMGTYGNAIRNCKKNLENKKLYVTADFDIDKLPGAENGERDSKEQAIKGLEAQGYKCEN